MSYINEHCNSLLCLFLIHPGEASMMREPGSRKNLPKTSAVYN